MPLPLRPIRLQNLCSPPKLPPQPPAYSGLRLTAAPLPRPPPPSSGLPRTPTLRRRRRLLRPERPRGPQPWRARPGG
ncbi:hypothetical protein BDA96_01G162600 [Sorghum bicolor]|uniref:Uncharacterized protein n=1 Tax=Sorghum bicolor TaxID=4558 RepID=A0A921RYD9_SORBI|nr:hypothetical protein BDA96_01G162600 [Sorghum bicolor]